MDTVRATICRSIWGEANMDCACKDSDGMSGGMLTIWNSGAFCRISSWFRNGCLFVNGF